MARKSSSPVEVTVTDSSLLTVTISQQALNLARQIVSAQGWAKAIIDIYNGGKLLAETFPELDSLDWIKQPEELRKLTPEEQKAYLKQDEEWGSKQVNFTVSPAERDAIERAFNHFSRTAASAKQLGPNAYLYELIVAFSIKDTPEKAVDR